MRRPSAIRSSTEATFIVTVEADAGISGIGEGGFAERWNSARAA